MYIGINFIIACICISMFMLLVRGLKGPTIFDRILAANIFGTNAVLLIVMIAYSSETASFIDMALVYAFLNFVGTIALLRFFRYGKFSNENVEHEEEE